MRPEWITEALLSPSGSLRKLCGVGHHFILQNCHHEEKKERKKTKERDKLAPRPSLLHGRVDSFTLHPSAPEVCSWGSRKIKNKLSSRELNPGLPRSILMTGGNTNHYTTEDAYNDFSGLVAFIAKRLDEANSRCNNIFSLPGFPASEHHVQSNLAVTDDQNFVLVAGFRYGEFYISKKNPVDAVFSSALA